MIEFYGVRNFLYKIGNFWRWRKIIWNDMDWDFTCSIAPILAFKLKQTLETVNWDIFSIPNICPPGKDWSDEQCFIDASWAKNYCRIALVLIEKYIEDDDRVREWNLACEIIKTRSGWWWE